MISRSVDKRVGFVFLPRMAGRSTPMTGTDRSNLSYRTILILLVLLGMPMAARSDALEDSAKELARKIAAALSPPEDAAVDVRNISSLTPGEVADVERTLNAGLQNRGAHTPSNVAAKITVRVTLSESMKGLVWIAEIRHEDAFQVVLLTLAKPLENRMESDAFPYVLHSEKFWEGPERILDAAIVTMPSGNRWLVLLVPEGLLVRKAEGGLTSRFPLDSPQSKLRSPDGALLETQSTLSVLLYPLACTVVLEPPSLRECHPFPKLLPIIPIPGRGQVTGVESNCGTGSQILASGAGDASQPDTVQAFEWIIGATHVASEEISFPGPVLLHQQVSAPNPTAIVRNLETGNYEAYRLSISCAP